MEIGWACYRRLGPFRKVEACDDRFLVRASLSARPSAAACAVAASLARRPMRTYGRHASVVRRRPRGKPSLRSLGMQRTVSLMHVTRLRLRQPLRLLASQVQSWSLPAFAIVLFAFWRGRYPSERVLEESCPDNSYMEGPIRHIKGSSRLAGAHMPRCLVRASETAHSTCVR